MRTMFLAVALVVMAQVAMAQVITSTATDYLYVPTADVISTGDMQLDIWTISDEITDALGTQYDTAYSITAGLFDGVEVFATGIIGDEWNETSHIQGGVKYQFSPGSEADRYLKAAFFLYGLQDDQKAAPGVAFTFDNGSKVSASISGWVSDQDEEAGVGLSYKVAENVKLGGEYSSENKFAAGVYLNFKRLNGTVYWLDETDDLYLQVGTSLKIW